MLTCEWHRENKRRFQLPKKNDPLFSLIFLDNGESEHPSFCDEIFILMPGGTIFFGPAGQPLGDETCFPPTHPPPIHRPTLEL